MTIEEASDIVVTIMYYFAIIIVWPIGLCILLVWLYGNIFKLEKEEE